MKVGIPVKPHTSIRYIEELDSFLDFFEIYTMVNYHFDFLLKYRKPIVIHIPHFGDDINFANPSKTKESLSILKWGIMLANKYDSTKIIFHPGLIEDDSCSIDFVINFIANNYDRRFLVENMPYSFKGCKEIGGEYSEIRKILTGSRVGFCLDFTHALEYATRVHKEITSFVNQLLSLNPVHFHLTDTYLKTVYADDIHLNFWEGDLELEKIKNLIPKTSWVTLETPRNLIKQKEEIAFLKK
jgi:endonuclease IV